MSCRVELRRNSTGKACFGNIEEKVCPHYLRASIGSCHDFCKYGGNDAVLAKKRSSIPNRAERKQIHRSSEDGFGEIMVSVAKPRATLGSKLAKISMVTSDTNECEPPRKSSDSQKKQIGNKVLMSRNRTSLVKVNPPFLSNSNVSSIPKTRKQVISSTLKAETPSKLTSKEETAPKTNSERAKTHSKQASKNEETPLKSASERVKTHSKSASKKTGTSSKLSSLEGKEMEFSDKHVISLKPNSVAMRTIASVKSSEDFGGRRSFEIKMKKKEPSCKVALPLRASLSSSKPSLERIASINAGKNKGLKIASHLKNQPKPRKYEPKEHANEVEEMSHLKNQPKPRKDEPKEHTNEVEEKSHLKNQPEPRKDEPKEPTKEVEEKTLYVIMAENENESRTLESDQNASQEIDSSLSHSSPLPPPKHASSSISQSLSKEGQEESEHTTAESDQDSPSGNHESECMENGEKPSEAEENDKPQKDGIACGQDKYCEMSELNIFGTEPAETQTKKSSSCPRKLKFRREVLWNNNATAPEKVVLRHRNVHGKKDEQQVLFNNVIEETACKLVDTQKGKVKALVGAFETLISLNHEQKPYASNIVI